MMWTFATFMMTAIILMSMNNKNPVKLSMILMLTATLLSVLLFWTMSSSWFPEILYMLFLGGILIMFLILSTIMPNEKMKKIKQKSTILTTLTVMIVAMFVNSNLNLNSKLGEMKWLTQGNYNLSFCILIISMYFFMFTVLISKEKSSLRTML